MEKLESDFFGSAFIRNSSFIFCLKFCHLVFFAHTCRLKTNSIFDKFHTSKFQIVQFLTCKNFWCVNFKCVCSQILLIGSFGAPTFFFKCLKWPDNAEEARIMLSIIFSVISNFASVTEYFPSEKCDQFCKNKTTWQLGGKINFPSLI